MDLRTTRTQAQTSIPELRKDGGLAEAGGPFNNLLIVRMREHADLSQEALLPKGPQRKQAVYDDLLATAKRTQVAALAKLQALQTSGDVTKFESLFLPNAIFVTAKDGRLDAVTQALQGVADVSSVARDILFSVPGSASAPAAGSSAGSAYLRPLTASTPDSSSAPKIEWGVDKISAPKAWARGFDGTGVTIGIVDTGLDAAHPAIKGHYRGTQADGSQVNDYNWFDAISGKTAPYDDGEHGTHVAGSAAGGTSDHATGVAPGARIIAAKGLRGDGYNTMDGTLKALQWMLAPTKTDGTAADPTKGADVINNSWGTADKADTSFLESMQALEAAGIEVVNAAGNDGPFAGSVSPPGSYPGFFSVAATTSRDTVASFSSRGPSGFGKPGDMIPTLAAPGASITSSVPGGGYQNMSGTSMASPHVTGAIALLLQANPQATHAELEAALGSTAVDIDAKGDDAASGYGRIDVNAAITTLTGHGAHEAARNPAA